ncbi:hypothetical protein GOODEAATRI_033689, partial [Goodea atripinnis]
QTVCVGGAEHPCYKIAYFHDVSSRALCSGAVGGAKGEGTISDGDFWIGLTRVGAADNTLTPCSDLYQWTDGSVATFR